MYYTTDTVHFMNLCFEVNVCKPRPNPQAPTFHHSIPFVAHKRLTTTSAPLRSVRVRPSIILAEIDRINNKVRPSLAYQPTEDFLNSRSSVVSLFPPLYTGITSAPQSFDDETRSIRAQTAALLKRIHEPLPRASRPLPVILSRYQLDDYEPRATWYQPTVIWYPRQHGARYQPHVTWYLPHETKYPHVIRYPHETRYHHVTRYPYENRYQPDPRATLDKMPEVPSTLVTVLTYEDTPIPHRITSDAYINRMLNSTRNVQKDIINMSHYNDAASRSLGKLLDYIRIRSSLRWSKVQGEGHI
ncbi:unnamed protein product [Timema podura]|uniref:Uncharacterized protein n=1 Tax=Timema podura TaxID=61482 RepID=A0ABN7NT99_TIMPD|nr:unnamed protein product [Timema podura]